MLKKWLLVFALSFLASREMMAQVVTVQANVLPPYQINIADYRSRPNQIVILLTNTSNQELNVQLAGTITGDNGVQISTRAGFRSRQPVRLGPLEVQRLSADAIAQLFDVNTLDFTNITAKDIERTGILPEGMYQLCIRALNYRTLEPYSADAPSGCSNIFPVQNLEPPVIIKPSNEESVNALAPQNLVFTWTTPPSAPPSTEYVFRIVEMLNNGRNPNDAIQSNTGINAYEETVRGNVLLYGPGYPPLVAGRSYAVQVTAVSPFNNAIFRNSGKSEVIVFTYGANAVAGGTGTVNSGQKKKDFATHTIKGKLLWAFRKSEENYRPPSAVFAAGPPGAQAGRLAEGVVGGANTPGRGVQQVLVAHYTGHNALQASRPVTMGHTDPTLRFTRVAVAGITTAEKPEAAEFISSSSAASLEYSLEASSAEPGNNRFPLGGATVMIKGEKAMTYNISGMSGNTGTGKSDKYLPDTKKQPVTAAREAQMFGLRSAASLTNMFSETGNTPLVKGQPAATLSTRETSFLNSVISNGNRLAGNGDAILASGRTDAEGNFSIQMMHPDYEGLKGYSHLIVTVSGDDFGSKEFRISIGDLSGKEEIDLGEKILLANTYRFNPALLLEKPETGLAENPGFVVKIYREAADMARYPYLKEEGNVPADQKQEKVVNGRKMVLVSIDSLSMSAFRNMVSPRITFGFGQLFYKGKFLVEMQPTIGNFFSKQTDLSVTMPDMSSGQVLSVKTEYELKLKFPVIDGQVVLYAGESILPVPGAIVKVEYAEEDVEAKPSSSLVPGVMNGATATMNASVVSALNGIATNSAVSNQNAGLFSAAVVTSNYRVSTPVMATSNVGTMGSVRNTSGTSIAGATSITGVVRVLAPGDEKLSTSELIKKYGPHTVKTDSSGQFYIGNLPQLKTGKFFKLKLISVPSAFRDMETNPSTKEHQVPGNKGSRNTREFGITPVVMEIVGKVVDDQEQELPYARLHFKGSSTYFETGETGIFQTSYYEGKHILVIEKEGYVSREKEIEIRKTSSNNSSANSPGNARRVGRSRNLAATSTTNKPGTSGSSLTISDGAGWITNLRSAPTVQEAINSGQSFTPALFGNATPSGAIRGSTVFARVSASQPATPGNNSGSFVSAEMVGSFSHMINDAFRGSAAARVEKRVIDLGKVGFLPGKTGKILFKIVDKETGRPIPGASITLFDTAHLADSSGQWQYEGFGGNVTVTVAAPASRGYVTLKTSVMVQETGVVTQVTLPLEKGIMVSGKVSGGTQAIAGARVVPEGYDHLEVRSDNGGNYALFLPAGEHGLRASKSGFFTKTEQRTLVRGGNAIVNFDLQDGGDKKISHLLGFEIELDKAVPEGNGERWSGRFINLTPSDNAFNVSGAISLAFSNVRVNFDAAGNPTPQNNQVLTDAVNIPVKLYGYLPLVFNNEGGIKVVGSAQNKGAIKARLQLAPDQIQGSRGFRFLPSGSFFVVPATASGIIEVELFGSGTTPAAGQWKFAWGGTGDPQMELYGFKVALELSGSCVGPQGLNFAGSVHTPQLGPVGSVQFKLEAFSISKELRIQQVKVATNDLPTLDIAGWEAVLSSVLFNESGFKLGGGITISIPASGTSSVSFSNLSFSKDALYGGSFSLPNEGVNLMNIVKLKEGNSPLRFGRVGNSNVYSMNGSSSIQFDKLITKRIDIPLFQIQTDGKFLLQSPANFSADLGFAKFLVQNLVVSTTGQRPSIGIIGEFKSDLSMLKFTAGDIRFTSATGGGTSFSAGRIGAELDIPVMKCGLELGLKENGFSGAGVFGVPSTPISADVNFHYYKLSNGVDIGASFKSGIIIPIGIVSIEKVGGGFRYNSGEKKFMIDINGAASITGLGHGVRLNPIGLTVESGPYIRGYAGLEVVNSISVANVEIVLDVPGKHFTIQISSDVSPLEGLASARMEGLFKISFNPDNPYVFLGCGMQTKMLGIFNSYGEFALGANIKDPYTRNDDISFFFRHLDADLSSGGTNVFSGIYVHSGMKIGDRYKKYGFDITIASAQFWYEASSEVMLMLNFGGGQYKFRLKGYLGAGAELCAVGFCVGADFQTCYVFTGGRDAARGWYLSGQAAGAFSVVLGGCTPACNSVKVCWPWDGLGGARVCANAYAKIVISERQGLSLSAGAGGNPNFNGCN